MVDTWRVARQSSRTPRADRGEQAGAQGGRAGEVGGISVKWGRRAGLDAWSWLSWNHGLPCHLEAAGRRVKNGSTFVPLSDLSRLYSLQLHLTHLLDLAASSTLVPSRRTAHPMRPPRALAARASASLLRRRHLARILEGRSVASVWIASPRSARSRLDVGWACSPSAGWHCAGETVVTPTRLQIGRPAASHPATIFGIQPKTPSA